MEFDDERMRNRNKQRQNEDTVNSISKSSTTIKPDDITDGREQSKSKSRSRSRGRRPLSALFRKSSAVDESTESQNKNEVNDSEETTADVPISDINPRTDPRGHLQRMTVREALKYNRDRGRSPNRRALKLEKTLLNEGHKSSKESLSTSLPDLLDQISDGIEEKREGIQNEVKGGTTLPRVRKRGVVSLERPAFLDDTDNANKMLPLDKRKYVIQTGSTEDMDPENGDQESIGNKRSSIHSHATGDSGPISNINLPIDNTRRDSLKQFLYLRETKLESSVLPADNKVEQQTRFVPDLPDISISKSTTQESLLQPVICSDVFAEVYNNDRVGLRADDKLNNDPEQMVEKDIKPNENEGLVKQQKVDRQISSERDRSRRSSYVSPRRFSRASRSSEISNKSSLSDTSGLSVTMPNTEPVAQKTVAFSESPTGKYQRQFSRDSRKSVTNDILPPKVMVNKETNTDNELTLSRYVDSATQTVEKTPQYVDAMCQKSDDNGASENEESLGSQSEMVLPRDKNDHKQEVVKVEQNNKGDPTRRLMRRSVDSAFKPIKVDKARKRSEIIVDNTIEQLPDLSENISEANNKSNKKKSKKMKDKRRKSSASNKHRVSETDEVFTENKPQEHENKKSSKERKISRHSHELKVEAENNKSMPREHRPKRRSRSLVRNISKGKGDKSPRKAGRAASLNQVFESNVSVRKEDIEQTRLLGKSNMSRSLSSLNKESNETFHESLQKLKSDKKKKHSDGTNKHPKLSLAAIVTLKARIASMKKSRKGSKEKEHEEKVKVTDEEIDIPKDQNHDDNNDDLDVNDDLNTAKVFYENEINTSIGKSTNSIEIIEASDQEVKDIVYEKRLQFASPYCNEPMTEEELIKQRQRNTRLTSRRESKVRQRQKKVISCCKKFIAFLFSHIGLCSLVVAYCILGGFIFKELEGPHEMQKKREITVLRQNFTEMIHRLAFETTLTKGNREIFKTEVNAILRDFSVIIHKQTKEAGWDGQEIKNETKNGTGQVEPEQWSYPSSLLYAITVMTTIGESDLTLLILFSENLLTSLSTYYPYKICVIHKLTSSTRSGAFSLSRIVDENSV